MSNLDRLNTEGELSQELQPPSMYKVILKNDDYTPMDFVVTVLSRFFKKSEADATLIMMQIHHQGEGICGVYPFGIAETKVAQVNKYAKAHQHPLLCMLEKE